MADVLLLHAPDNSDDPRKGPPLALAYLSAQLKSRGYTTRIVDLNLFPDWHYLLTAWLNVFAPRLIAISSTAFSIQSVAEVAALCKRWNAKVPVIVGGYCSLVSTLREIADIDAYCMGEGDWVLCEIMEQITRGDLKFDSIKSLAFRDKGGGWILNSRRSLLIEKDLDALPFPDFTNIEPARYGDVPALPLYVQRGCYNACRFCDIATFYNYRGVRAMSPTRVAEWVHKAKNDFAISYIQFMDDDFLSSPAWFDALARELQFVPGQYILQANFQTRPRDILRAQKELCLHASFIYQIELGIESFSPSQLKRWRKHQSLQDINCAIKFLNKIHIPTLAYLIFSDRETTIDELKENVVGLMRSPPLCSFPNRTLIPAVVACHDINTMFSLTGEREIAGIPFLETFDEILQATTDSAEEVYYFYLALKSAIDQTPSRNIIHEIGLPLLTLIEKIFSYRLTRAVEAANQVYISGTSDWQLIAKRVAQEINDIFEGISRDIAKMPNDFRISYHKNRKSYRK